MKPIIKRTLAIFFSLCIGAALLEVGSIALYPVLFGGPFSRKNIQIMLALPESRASDDSRKHRRVYKWKADHILHPYLGFVGNPGIYSLNREFTRNNGSMVLNEHGFLGKNPLTKRSPNQIIAVILGGSFAMNFYLDSRDTLKDQLSHLQQFRGKKIRIISLALSGYKQPQQLLALNYFLSLGAEYDLVINLDGFNEIALPYAENIPSNVFPFFPRLWNIYASDILNPERTIMFADILRIKQSRERLQLAFSSPLLSFTNFGLITWQVLDSRIDNQVRRKHLQFEQQRNEEETASRARNFEKLGPRLTSESKSDSVFQRLVDQWANSSLQMASLEQTNHFKYFHFLQPNQYVRNSKSFTKQEKSDAYYKGAYTYKLTVERGYPLLIRKGREFLAKRLNYTDLTMVYKDTASTVYEDMCCHVNKDGNDLIAKAIVRTIQRSFQQGEGGH